MNASRVIHRRLPSLARLTLAALLGACASGGGAAPSPGTPSPSPGTRSPSPGETATASQPWVAAAREHVDLWLHGYAMLTQDTAHVPLFERGYRQRITALRSQRGVATALDANRDRLMQRLAANPALVNGQFVALYFGSFEDLQQAVNYFVQAQGDPRATQDPTIQSAIGLLAASFPSPADRDWVRLFTQSLAEERSRFYHDYWTSEQQARAAARIAVDSLWQRVYRPRFQRYLSATQQENGELLLSLPLDGEGRTVTVAKQQNVVAVAHPATAATAAEAIYVFAHEVIGAVANTAIADNTTPAQQRSGESASYAANGAVRGGALLVRRVAPELLPGYMRYYLRSAGRSAPGADPSVAFAAAFPLPQSIVDALARQLDVVLGGI